MITLGIAGTSSSGKTTLTNNLLEYFPGAHAVHMDDHYKSPEDIPRIEGTDRFNLDVPGSFDFESYHQALSEQRLGGYSLAIAEGLYPFLMNPELFDRRIVLDVPDIGLTLSRRPEHYENDEQYQKLIIDAKREHLDRQLAVATHVIIVTPEKTPDDILNETVKILDEAA